MFYIHIKIKIARGMTRRNHSKKVSLYFRPDWKLTLAKATTIPNLYLISIAS